MLCDFGQLTHPLWASHHHPSRDVWTVPGGPATRADLRQLGSHTSFSLLLLGGPVTHFSSSSREVLCPQPVWLSPSSNLWDRLQFACAARLLLPVLIFGTSFLHKVGTTSTPNRGAPSRPHPPESEEASLGWGRGAGASGRPAWERAALGWRKVYGSEEKQTPRGAWGGPGPREGQRRSPDPLRPPCPLPGGFSTCHRGHRMLSCVGQEGPVRMMISNFITSEAAQPPLLGKLPDWGLSPPCSAADSELFFRRTQIPLSLLGNWL